MLLGLFTLACLQSVRCATAQMAYERPPIDYLNAPVHDAIAQLQASLDSGEVLLAYDEDSGYLASLLAVLEIRRSSQVLVFSKTSFQQAKISPRRPRALYFNDHIYMGWVQQGDVIEISSIDPQQGAIFYTLSQKREDRPRFERQTHDCLICHGATNTGGIPGNFVRSVYPDRSGRPMLSAGSFRTDYTSPLAERWGGWYVSGTHGRQRHMGNVLVSRGSEPELLDVEAGANVTDLTQLGSFDVAPYVTPHSDIVALMVLEHQTAVQNALTAANYSARITIRDAEIMNEALERAVGYESDSTRRRFDSAAEKLVERLLVLGEQPLTSPIAGTTKYRQEFEQQGPFDSQGRSLRTFDLTTRLFKYPCSYLIYSEAFDALPEPVRSRALRRLWDVLSDPTAHDKYRHLTRDQCRTIQEILLETKPHLPDYWKLPGLPQQPEF